MSVGRTSANDFDPKGDEEEHAEEAPLVVDRDPGTTWSTETYADGLAGANKDGVGIYIDAKPGVTATRMEIQTTQPGWSAEIYGASGGAVPADLDSGWTRLGDVTMRDDKQRFKINRDGERFRYYLVWITSLPADQRVEISEIALFRPSD